MKILVYAYRDWSFENIKPALEGFDYDRYWAESGKRLTLNNYDLAITCEPHIAGWRELYPYLNKKIPILALQQSLFWVNARCNESIWLFDKMMCWGEMQREMNELHDLPKYRMVITGNPRFDKFWDMPVKNKDYTLVLCSRGEQPSYFADFCGGEKVKFQLHPHSFGNVMQKDTDELIRCADKVVFSKAGYGIVAMIMGKPCMILEAKDGEDFNGHYRYLRSKLYNTKKFGVDKDFVKYAVTDNQATRRVRECIQRYE